MVTKCTREIFFKNLPNINQKLNLLKNSKIIVLIVEIKLNPRCNLNISFSFTKYSTTINIFRFIHSFPTIA